MEGTIENNTFLEKYYCPLKFNLYDRDAGEDEDECWYEIDGKYGSEYEGAINDLLEKEHSYDGCSPEDMAKYQDNPKVLSAAWGVENVNGTLYGCIDVKLSSTLTPDEEEALKRWISGQNSDGFGEGLEQRPFYEGDIEGYVSFWNSGNDYFVKNKAELLLLGLMTWKSNMLLGLGVMLAANEVPNIAKHYGLDTSIKVHFSSAVHNPTRAVNAIRAVAKK